MNNQQRHNRSVAAWLLRRTISLEPAVRRHGLAMLGFAVAVVVLFREIVFGGRTLFERDIHLIWQPQVWAFVQSIAAGSWPVWDRSSGFGQPLWADPSAQVLYPTTWLNLILPPGASYTVLVVLHLWIGAFGLYRLAQKLGATRLGAFAGGLVWLLSGPIVSLANVWHHFVGAAWVPWVVLAAESAATSPGLGTALRWILVVAIQILAGSADMCVMSALVSGARLLGHLDWRAPVGPANRRHVGSMAIVYVAALALTAALWLPAFDLIKRSRRWQLPSADRVAWSVHPGSIMQMTVPVRLTDMPLRPELRKELFESREAFVRSLYLGLPALGLVAAALIAARRSTWSFGWIGFVGLLVSFGRFTPFYAIAVTLMPPLKILRYPSKVFVVVTLSWSLLCAFGVDALTASRLRGRRWKIALAALAAALLQGFVCWAMFRFWADALGPRFFLPPPPPTSFTSALAPVAGDVGLAVCCGAVFMALLVLARGRSVRWLGAALTFLVAVDLFVVNSRINPTAPTNLLTAPPPTVRLVNDGGRRPRIHTTEYIARRRQSLLSHDDPYLVKRVPGMDAPFSMAAALRFYLFPPVGSLWGIDYSFDPDFRGLYATWLRQLLDRFETLPDGPDLVKVLRMGSVTHVASLHAWKSLVPVATVPSLFVDPATVSRVPDPLPRVYAVGGARVLPDHRALDTILDPSFDLAREAILASGDEAQAAPGFSGVTRVLDERPDRLLVEAQLSEPGFVAFTETFDPAWRATVDNRPAAIARANIVFRAVAVPAGRHVVELRCRPASLVWGLTISGAAILLVALVGAALRGRALTQRSRDDRGMTSATR